MVDVVQNDTGSTLTVKCMDLRRNAIDLTDAAVFLLYRIMPADKPVEDPPQKRTMIVSSPQTAGIALYTFSVNEGKYDLSDAGILTYWVQIVFADGSVLTSPQASQITIVKSPLAN